MTPSARRLLTERPSSPDPKAALRIWQPLRHDLQRSLPDQAFHTWFDPLKPLSLEDHTLIVEVPSRFYYEWIEGHYAPLLDTLLDEAEEGPISLHYVIDPQTNGRFEPEPAPAPVRRPQAPPAASNGVHPNAPAATNGAGTRSDTGHGLNDRYTFATFIEGPPNRFARAAAFAVASDSPGATSYNPLLIYGGVGLGKTHLLQAIGHATLERDPAAKVRYISSERFTKEFVESIKTNRGDQFNSRYRDVDLLLMDDVQFLAGRDRTLLEFFHIFNALHQDGRQIVLSSDKPPRELQGLDERLVSRFSWGLVCDIGPPDFDTRVAIIETLSEQEGVSLPIEVIEYLATRITKNVREMQGAIVRLIAHASLIKRDLTLDIARQALRDLIHVRERRITVEMVQRVVADHYQVGPDLLLAKIRSQPVAKARMVAMALSIRLCQLSLKQVGAQFGGRDHTTVLHARKKIDEWEQNDPEMAALIAELVRRIEAVED